MRRLTDVYYDQMSYQRNFLVPPGNPSMTFYPIVTDMNYPIEKYITVSLKPKKHTINQPSR